LIRTKGHVVEAEAPTSPSALEALVERGVYFDGYWQNEAFILDIEGFRDACAARSATGPRRPPRFPPSFTIAPIGRSGCPGPGARRAPTSSAKPWSASPKARRGAISFWFPMTPISLSRDLAISGRGFRP
jgi:hypothetical protein